MREDGLPGFGKRRGGEERRVGREADRCIDGVKLKKKKIVCGECVTHEDKEVSKNLLSP